MVFIFNIVDDYKTKEWQEMIIDLGTILIGIVVIIIIYWFIDKL